MPRGGKRVGAGRKPSGIERRVATFREYLRQRVSWPEIVQTLEAKAIEGNVQASKLLIEIAYGTAVSMSALEETEKQRLSVFNPEWKKSWEDDAEQAGSAFEVSAFEVGPRAFPKEGGKSFGAVLSEAD